MKTQAALTTLLILLSCSSLIAGSVTVDPSDPMELVTATQVAGRSDTVFLLPGTYVVGDPPGAWPIHLTQYSPSYVGVGGPEGVVILGTGVEEAFFLDEGVWDAHIGLQRITFHGLKEIIGRVSTIDGSRGEIHFTDNIVEECGSGQLYPALRATGCSGIIARNVFRNNPGYGIGTYHTTAAIEDNEIYGSLGGIHDQCCESPAIRRNHVHDNTGVGIDTGYTEGGPIEYNLIERNGGTGLALGSDYTVEHNIIRENTRGVSCGGMLTFNADVHFNDIYDNVQYNLLSGNQWANTHDCTMNWWGSLDPDAIAEGIRDANDDPYLHVTVLFDPYCRRPGCGPTPVESDSWGAIKALFRR